MKKLDLRTVKSAAKILRLISHPERLRMVEALEGGEKSVTRLMKEVGLSQVAASKHLSVMKKGGVVRSRTSANFRHYSIAYPNVVSVLDCLRKHGGRR